MVEISAMIAIVMGVSEAVKRLGIFPAKSIPLVNILLAVAASFMWTQSADWHDAALQGVIVGLSASGLYSGAKNVIQEVNTHSSDAKNNATGENDSH